MRRALSRIILTGVIIASSFGVLSGSNAGAAGTCVITPVQACVTVKPGASASIYHPRVGFLIGGAQTQYEQYGANFTSPSGKSTLAVLFCNEDEYALAYGVNRSTPRIRNLGIPC